MKHNVKRSHSDAAYGKYYERIEKIIEALDSHQTIKPEVIAKVQSALDKLSAVYGSDKALGADRYALLHAQALIYDRSNKTDQAVEYMEAAIRIRGGHYPEADDFIQLVRGEPAEQPKKRAKRINRSTYFLSDSLAVVLYALAAVGIDSLDQAYNADGSSLSILGIILTVTAVILCVMYSVPLTLRRLRDLNMSGWWLLGFFVPFVGLYITWVTLFSEGHDEANTFGPKATKRWGIWLLNA